MKKIYRFAALLVACLTLATFFVSCNNKQDPNAPEGFVTASADCADYYLYVPSDWTVDTGENSLMASARANTYSSTPNVSMMPCTDDDSEFATIQDYWTSYQSSLEKLFDEKKDEEGNLTGETSFAMDGEGTTCKVGGFDGVKYSYKATLAGIELQYVQLVIKKDTNLYIFTYTATPDTYEEEVVNEIINNIKFKQ